MPYARDIRWFYWYYIYGLFFTLIAVFPISLLLIIVYFDHGIIGMIFGIPSGALPSLLTGMAGETPVLLAGIIFLFLSICCAPRLKRRTRMLWVFKNVEANQMWLTIYGDGSGDNPTYYARLSKDGTDTILASIEGGAIIGPYRTIKALEKKQAPGKQLPVKVYVDPKTGKPDVIETEIGLLWLG